MGICFFKFLILQILRDAVYNHDTVKNVSENVFRLDSFAFVAAKTNNRSLVRLTAQLRILENLNICFPHR